jgi:hypothetical protein
MEFVRFFFSHFWHFVGLCVVLSILRGRYFTITGKDNEGSDKNE